MSHFLGEFDCKLDVKGRMMIPALAPMLPVMTFTFALPVRLWPVAAVPARFSTLNRVARLYVASAVWIRSTPSPAFSVTTSSALSTMKVSSPRPPISVSSPVPPS